LSRKNLTENMPVCRFQMASGEGMDGEALKSKLAEVSKLVPYIKMVKNEKLATRLMKPEKYRDLGECAADHQ
jgi:hypothetical protein